MDRRQEAREECEEKLKVLIAEMKAELAELKRQKADAHWLDEQNAAAHTLGGYDCVLGVILL